MNTQIADDDHKEVISIDSKIHVSFGKLVL